MKYWDSILCLICALFNVPFFTVWKGPKSFSNVIAFFVCLALSLFYLITEIEMSNYGK